MWLLAIAIFAGLKWGTWWKARRAVPHEPWRFMAYLLAWPGMKCGDILDSNQRAAKPQNREWLGRRQKL